MTDAILFPAKPHDHQHCVDTALDEAGALCLRRGVRLTRLRRRVLELVWSSHQPAGAYAILDALRAENRNAAPPTVYRALEFLHAHGLVHRIESLNAYIGCVQPRHPHSGQFLICQSCGVTMELHDQEISDAVSHSAGRRGFEALHQTVEITGLCSDCRNEERAG